MNNKVTVVIIDDEKDGRDYIALLLANEFPELEVVYQAANIEEAYLYLSRQWPDIIFLDIQLAEGNAFELLEKFSSIPSLLIFVTAYEQYAIRAIKKSALDYLLKPVRKLDFVEAVNRALQKLKSPQVPVSVTNAGRISLPSLHGFRLVEVADIIRCEADSNYTTFYLADKTRLMVSKTLQEFEAQLLPHHFFRIHHKYLVNLKHVKEYIRGKGGQVVMSDGSTLDVSARRKTEFLQQLQLPD